VQPDKRKDALPSNPNRKKASPSKVKSVFFWPGVLNGVLAAPLMAVIMHMASSKRVMDKVTIPLYLRIVGWAATAVMFAVSVGVFATWQ
jgi:Mn2+/Fe2+ NRAMP family transporter